MTKALRILYLGSTEGFEALREVAAGCADVLHVEADAGKVGRALLDVDALLDASMKVRITDDMVRRASRLKIISCATTGSDHIERGEVERRNIAVRTLREDRELLMDLTPAAELSWALLMACARRLPAALEEVRAGKWTRENFPGVMLNGRRLGIIGCGRIGGWMARYGRAFGMTVAGFDPYLKKFPAEVESLPLIELAETSDCISIHVHLTDETRGLMSRELCERIKPGAILINTSRGAVIDEAALLDGLMSGRIGAAGLDVLEGEPDIAEHPLVAYARTHANLLITPHIGGFSPDAVRKVCRRAARKILTHLEVSP